MFFFDFVEVFLVIKEVLSCFVSIKELCNIPGHPYFLKKNFLFFFGVFFKSLLVSLVSVGEMGCSGRLGGKGRGEKKKKNFFFQFLKISMDDFGPTVQSKRKKISFLGNFPMEIKKME